MQKDEEIVLTDEIISALKEETPPEEYESFLKKIKENDPDALFNLSVICQYTGCSSDEFWMDVLKKASDLGCEGAQKQLADLYNIDSEEKKLPFSKRGKEWELYKKLAEKGNQRGLFMAGCYYLDQDNPEYNFNKGEQYLEKVGDENDSLAEFVGSTFEGLGDYDRAIKYYKKARAYGDYDGSFMEGYDEIDDEGIQIIYYATIANAYFEKKDYPNTIKYADKGIATLEDGECYYLRGKVCLQNDEWDKAVQYFKKSRTPESFLELGLFYKDSSIKENKEKALYYFKKADKKYDCSYFISTLEKELKLTKQDEFAIHIENIIDDEISTSSYPKIVESELKSDFGDYWNDLTDFTKSVLITGIVTLFYFESCEKKSPDLKLDYSGVITSVSRALEKETKEYFFLKYKAYLKKKKINPEFFVYLQGFVEKVDHEGIYEYRYTKIDYWYTLGKLKKIVNKKEGYNEFGLPAYKIDKQLLKYCDSFLFKKDAFSKDSKKRQKEINEYMIKLGEDTANIANDYRNEAAHTECTSDAEKARACVEWIVKVKKVLLELIEKIDFEKMKEFNSSFKQ